MRTYRHIINLCIVAMTAGVLISTQFGDSLVPKILLLCAGLAALATHIVAKVNKLKDADCEDEDDLGLQGTGIVASAKFRRSKAAG